MNKKGIADLSDPTFWGICGVLWLVCLAVTWKGLFGAWADVKMKIGVSLIALLPCIGIPYLMGGNG